MPERGVEKSAFNNEGLDICEVACSWGMLVKFPGVVGEFTRYEITLVSRKGGVKCLIIRYRTPWMASTTQGVRDSDKQLEANLHGFIRAGRYTQFTSYAFFMIKQDMHLFSVH